MGEDVIDPTDLTPDKNYCITVDEFNDASAKTGCDQDYRRTFHCCRLGQVIMDWLDDDKECDSVWQICPSVGSPAQKIVDVQGPYDTWLECMDECR